MLAAGRNWSTASEFAARGYRLAVDRNWPTASEFAARGYKLAVGRNWSTASEFAARGYRLAVGRNWSTASEFAARGYRLAARGEGLILVLVLLSHNTVSTDESLNPDMQLTRCQFQSQAIELSLHLPRPC